MKVNDELEITTAETDHVDFGLTLPLELNILLNSSVKFDSILQQIFVQGETHQTLPKPSRGDLIIHVDS